ncbi:MAG: hypothetical protein CM1200mP24_07200 [Gammaproteobacteria bacterium]|nr:MAG: hypothetical protein CM1200mP24_07200 [Gammaproteobacteria bacterium]
MVWLFTFILNLHLGGSCRTVIADDRTSGSQLAGRIFFSWVYFSSLYFSIDTIGVVVIASFDSAEILSFRLRVFTSLVPKNFLSAEGVWLDSMVLSIKIAVLATIIRQLSEQLFLYML